MSQQVLSVDADHPEVGDLRLRELETRRRYYLQALGVDLYLPRQALPNAKTSIPLQPLPIKLQQAAIQKPGLKTEKVKTQAILGVQAIPDVEAAEDKKSEDLKPSSMAALNKIESKLNSTQPQSKPSADAEIETKIKTSANNIRFNLRVWRVSNDLLIIDSREAELALPTDALLRNIVLALGYAVSDISKSESLRWPPMRYTDAEKSEVEARAMVQAYIEAQQQKYGFTTALLLGAAAHRFIVPAEYTKAEHGLWQTASLFEQCKAIVLPSLTLLLQQPSLKKNTWQCIKHLRRPLAD